MENFNDSIRAFERYCRVLRADVEQPTIDLIGHGSILAGRPTLRIDAEFYSQEAFIHLATDLARAQRLDEEEAIRTENPTLQHAWEEYQLLLKLSK